MNEISLEESLVRGSGGLCTTNILDDKPLVVRGVTSKSEIEQCIAAGRDYYYIDTGYLGNFPSVGNPSGKKIWHRIVKNGLQHPTIKDVPSDRWKRLVKQDPRLEWTGWKSFDKKILLVLPNPKACRFYNIDCDKWIAETTEAISKHIDLPIEIRVKGSRSFRNKEYTIYDAFDSGVYATVSFNSIASLESVLYGIPAFASVPCAASPLVDCDLKNITNLYRPDEKTILNQCKNLAYGQFTQEEILNGTAWSLLK
jgi:hypothetical protein